MPTTIPDPHRPLPPFERPDEVLHRRNRQAGTALKAALALLGIAVVAGCAGGAGSSLTPGGALRGSTNIARALPAVSPTPAPADQQACAPPKPGQAACQVQKNPKKPPTATPDGGLTPAQLRSAYGLGAAPTTIGTHTVAIVDAFEDANAEADLAKYRAQFGLPACTTKNGCFTKVMMPGAKVPPGPPNSDFAVARTTWEDEIALDLAMASASCPNCKLLLVEAGGQDLDSLAAAVVKAASYHPAAISNSWGVPENDADGIDAAARAAFDQPGIAITASTGDSGWVQFPASSPYVTAVGGTSLSAASDRRGWSESAWYNSGNGCSTIFAAPSWQGRDTGCYGGARAVPDVEMLADYNPGVAVFVAAHHGWEVLGGTSLGAPFVAGLYAAANDYGSTTTGAPALYANANALNDVSGSRVGSPNGLIGF